jgi:tRNA-splicing ligase RtcB
MEAACTLPIAVRGALMPDAHLGYGLPIGGVLATRNAVIPYAIGVDIACRMRMTVWDEYACNFTAGELSKILMNCTKFGMGCHWDEPLTHPVMDDPRWDKHFILADNFETARAQLGTSGGGNHFAEFGELNGLATAPLLALMTHSGSRGVGHKVCQHFHNIAKSLHPELPKELKHLAWLDLDTEEGQAYWECMELMGEYAAANHELIHNMVDAAFKYDTFRCQLPSLEITRKWENHHNFAWKEEHFGEELIVHRKGATPAHIHSTAIIPGTMGDSAYIVRGKAKPESLKSASHGAGRKLSRKKAKQEITPEERERYLQEKGVILLSGGMDEAPQAYKDIKTVMAEQADLVWELHSFDPWIVRMAEEQLKPWERKKR